LNQQKNIDSLIPSMLFEKKRSLSEEPFSNYGTETPVFWEKTFFEIHSLEIFSHKQMLEI
jgi:hypothetical protein